MDYTDHNSNWQTGNIEVDFNSSADDGFTIVYSFEHKDGRSLEFMVDWFAFCEVIVEWDDNERGSGYLGSADEEYQDAMTEVARTLQLRHREDAAGHVRRSYYAAPMHESVAAVAEVEDGKTSVWTNEPEEILGRWVDLDYQGRACDPGDPSVLSDSLEAALEDAAVEWTKGWAEQTRAFNDLDAMHAAVVATGERV